MVKPVTMYRAADGSVYETLNAAERAEAVNEIRAIFLHELGTTPDLDDVVEAVMKRGDDILDALRIAFGPRAAED